MKTKLELQVENFHLNCQKMILISNVQEMKKIIAQKSEQISDLELLIQRTKALMEKTLTLFI